MSRTNYSNPVYPYSRVDGAAVAHPLFQGEDGGSIPTSALHLRVESIGLPTARQLVALWHSALPEFPPMAGGLPYHDCYVATYDDHWYAVAIWTGPVNRDLNNGTTYELRRFAIAPSAPRNTASRMLAVMSRDIRKKRPEIAELISYQLLDTHRGTIYKASGWQHRHFSRGHGWDASEGGGRVRPVAQNSGDKMCWHLLINRQRSCVSSSPVGVDASLRGTGSVVCADPDGSVAPVDAVPPVSRATDPQPESEGT